MPPVKSFAVLAALFSAASAQAQPIFSETFESGSAAWSAADGNDIVVTSDSDTCSTQYQHETIPYSGGRVMTVSPIVVTGGNTYCVSAFVRASSDALPFLGINTSSVAGPDFGTHWLMGYPGYPDGYGGYAVVINDDGAWHWYAATVTLDASTVSLQITYELTNGGFADFDDIEIDDGACSEAYVGVDQHQVCTGDTPVCGSEGACHPAPPDMGGVASPDMASGATAAPDMASGATAAPDMASGATASPDMASGATAAPDMGAAGVSSPYPWANQALTPSQPPTPVAAQGAPSGAGPVSAPVAGCSIGGREGHRSFGMMMLAFVAVMFFGRRKRT